MSRRRAAAGQRAAISDREEDVLIESRRQPTDFDLRAVETATGADLNPWNRVMTSIRSQPRYAAASRQYFPTACLIVALCRSTHPDIAWRAG